MLDGLRFFIVVLVESLLLLLPLPLPSLLLLFFKVGVFPYEKRSNGINPNICTLGEKEEERFFSLVNIFAIFFCSLSFALTYKHL